MSQLNNMSLTKFLANPGSTTIFFKKITKEYQLKILDNNYLANRLERITIIELDHIPVMLNLSYTSLTNSKFIDILENAATTPIGTKLFVPNSGIKRAQMSVSQIGVNQIDNVIIQNYMHELGLDTKTQLYVRQSQFTYQDEVMHLVEYILPGLVTLLETEGI